MGGKTHWRQQDLVAKFYMALMFHNFTEIYKFLAKNRISSQITSSKKMSRTLIKFISRNNNSKKLKRK